MPNDELRYVNAIIGFFKPAGGWPCPFRELGYDVVGIQRPVLSTSGKGPRKIVPELICASASQQHVVAIDVKTARLTRPQAEGYAALTGEQIVTQGMLGADFGPTSTVADGAFVTSHENVALVDRRLQTWNLSVTTISDEGSQFRISRGTFANQTLNQIFLAGIKIPDPSAWPTHFISTSSDSTPAELAPHVMIAAAAYIIQGETFTDEEIGAKAIDHWRLCGQQEKSTYVNKVHALLSEAYLDELQGFFKPESMSLGAPAKGCRWVPEHFGQLHFKRRTSLMRRATEFCDRKAAGLPYVRNQPRLF